MEKHSSKKKLFVKLLIIFLCSIFTISMVMFYIIRFTDKVHNNVYLVDKEVSGYEPETLVLYIEESKEKFNNLKIVLTQNDKQIFTILPDMINAQIDINETLKSVHSYGRNKDLSFFQNIKNIIRAYTNKINCQYVITYDEEKMEALLKNIDLTLDGRVEEDKYTIDKENNKLVLIKGKDGNILNYDNTKNEILNAFSNLTTNEIEVCVDNEKSKNLDFNLIKEKVNVNAQNAYIDKSSTPIKFVEEKTGYHLEDEVLISSIKEIDNLKYNEKIELELETVEPEVKLKDIYFDMYNDRLASYTTYFAGNQLGRSKNIEIASSYLNEVIVMPGEIFSFNDTIGSIDKAKGYMEAATFQGGKVVSGLGGGVCQVSSNLYNTVLLANLEIVERYAHGLPVSYVLPSRDATIYVGVLDFKFKNTRNYPIKIITAYSQVGSLTISIYGRKEEIEYEIDIESNTIQTIEAPVEYVYDNNLEKGHEEIIESGSDSIISEAYLIKKLNGSVQERKFLSRDVYSGSTKVVKVGTK